MGTLRTLFAITVVLAHSAGNLLVGGRNAVQLFYIISGFLISYILVERKAYPNVKNFYINRYLRLYPIYFVIALLTLVAWIFASIIGKNVNFFNTYSNAPFAADILLVISNGTILFQDWVMFSGVEENALVFSTNFLEGEVQLYQGLLVVQGWTLGLELSFYLLAPFILLKKKNIILLLAGSVLLRIYIIRTGLGNQDPWTYRFFPTELALFLIGALAHQVLLPIYRKSLNPAEILSWSRLSTFFLIFLTLVFSFIPVNYTQKSIVFFIVFIFLMPLTFIYSSNQNQDKLIGDLSYPIYISHMLVIDVSKFLILKLIPTSKFDFIGRTVYLDRVVIGISAVIFSIAVSVLLNKFVGRPVERFRNRFKFNN